MAPSRAVRVLNRPMRSLLLDQYAQISRPTPRFPKLRHDSRNASPLCLSCTIRAGFRLYSTDSKTPDAAKKSEAAAPSSTADQEPSLQSDGARPEQGATSPPSPDLELPSASEAKRSVASARFSHFMDDLQSRALVAGQKLNDLTGYTAIEAIKERNAALESELAAAQARLRTARHAYKSLTSTRASTQREVTTLLARKDTWNPADLERFTTLYRSDHELEAQVAAASAELTEAEAEEGKLSAALNAGILRRYHEEQIWSDRIRRQSTWGTWGLMGVNVLLFLVLQFVAEPWKRARLIRGVAEGEKTYWEEVRRDLDEMKAALAVQAKAPAAEEAVASAPAAAAANVGAVPEIALDPGPGSWQELVLDPKRWGEGLADLCSERRIGIRMRDASLIALEGAVTGAAVAAGAAFWLLRRT
ncbi:hypothetical protein GQ53DRAFT_741168 [Thozetella sp. PMI_491]|nr:hypothetical protein GQ53DRAFT_741168 [Thozetella sp. PMI_491]